MTDILALTEVADVLERAPRQDALPDLPDAEAYGLISDSLLRQLASSVRHHAVTIEIPPGSARQLDPVLDGPVNPDA